MNEQPEIKFRNTLEAIRLHFDFLFKRGFRIVSVMFAGQKNEDWQVTLFEGNRLIHIYSEMGIINLVMSTLRRSTEIISFNMEAANNSREFFYTLDELPISESQQLKKIAHFFEKNLVTILAQAEKDSLPFPEYPMHTFVAPPKRTII